MRSLQKPSYLKFRVADGAAFGFDDPCQVFRTIGSILGGGLVETGDRGQGLTGPEDFFLKTLEYTWRAEFLEQRGDARRAWSPQPQQFSNVYGETDSKKIGFAHDRTGVHACSI